MLGIVLLEARTCLGQDSAALMLGGYRATYDTSLQRLLSDVEIFGCDTPKAPADLQFRTYMMEGVYIEDGEDPYVLACGGTECDGSCNVSTTCYEYRPSVENAWVMTGQNMTWSRFAFLLADMP